MIDRRRFTALALAAPLLLPVRSMAGVAPPLVTTTSGPVRGRRADGLCVFTGVPYGQAARLAPARPAPRWTDLYDATAPAAVAPQAPGMAPLAGAMREDCLQLNVWAPDAPGPHPVLVYIHGGANETGWSGEPVIAGDRFAAMGIVAVTVNYRVGAFGFLEAGGLLGARYAGSANNGMRDLVLALRWVRANIARFGGDPRRVTIAGESAGGKNVGTLMGMPAADGLYARAAIFSGGGETVASRDEAEAFARLFADRLGGAEALLSAPVERMLAAQHAAKADWPRNFPFRPMVDGHDLPEVPLARLARAAAPPVPLLIGSNADESRLFLTAAAAGAPLRSQAVANAPMARMETLDRAYARAFPELSIADRHWRLLTAEEYGMPCLRLAEAQAARGAPVWRYRLELPAPAGPFQGHTPHAFDIPLTFDHLGEGGVGKIFGLSSADQPIASAMHAAMVAFVTGGAPAASGLPAWDRFDRATRATMVIDRTSRLLSDPDRQERLIWQG
jgi:para-nitrobenzyl esterase